MTIKIADYLSTSASFGRLFPGRRECFLWQTTGLNPLYHRVEWEDREFEIPSPGSLTVPSCV